jgi:glycosyltransferase involved in cell wall biosynthesis
VPVIASAVPCLDEKIRASEGGLTFRAGDAADLASQLRSIVSDPQVLDRMKENMRNDAVSRIEEEAFLYERIYGTA